MELKLNKKDILAILIIGLLIIFFFGYVLFTDLTFVYRDFSRYFYPLYHYGVLCLKQGILPFWNPYVYCGMPFFALIQLAIFYPISIIFYLFPFMLSLKLFIVIHYFLAGVFVYFLMRHWNLCISSALISSLTYIFSGYMLSCIDLTNTLTSVTWIPIIFFLYSIAIKSNGLIFTLLSGTALGIQLLGGDPVVFYLSLITLFLWTLWYFSFKAMRRYFLVVLIALGLTLFQTLPFFELTLLSTRGKGVGLNEATKWAFSQYEFLNLIVPFFNEANTLLHQQFFKSLHLGILPLLFSLIAIFFRQQRKLVIFWIIILISFITVSYGGNLYKFFYKHIPLFNMMRYPIKSFCIINFSISILAGFGFQYLLGNLEQKKRSLLVLPAISLMVVCILCWIKGGFFLFKEVNELFGYFHSPCLGIFLLCIFCFLIYVGNRMKLWLFSAVVISLVSFELMIFGWPLNPVINQNIYNYVPETVKVIKSKDGFYRFLLEPKTEKRYREVTAKSFLEASEKMQSVLAPNMGMYYFLFDAYGYEAIPIVDYDRFIYFLKNVPLPNTWKLISMINVKYIISEDIIKGLNLVCVIKDKDRIVRIYENKGVLPRAYLVAKVRVVKNRKEAFKAVISASFDPTKEVILESPISNPQSPISNLQSRVEIINYQPNKIILNASSSVDCFLFMSETYYPGWKAYVDGQKTEIYRANYIFRAIKFPKGNHQVEFVYFPLSFKTGLFGSLLTLILMVIGVVTGKMDYGIKN
ncbi:MAG: YfhO family protein [bacterium]